MGLVAEVVIHLTFSPRNLIESSFDVGTSSRIGTVQNPRSRYSAEASAHSHVLCSLSLLRVAISPFTITTIEAAGWPNIYAFATLGIPPTRMG